MIDSYDWNAVHNCKKVIPPISIYFLCILRTRDHSSRRWCIVNPIPTKSDFMLSPQRNVSYLKVARVSYTETRVRLLNGGVHFDTFDDALLIWYGGAWVGSLSMVPIWCWWYIVILTRELELNCNISRKVIIMIAYIQIA